MSFTAPYVLAGASAGTVGAAYDYTYAVSPGSFGPPYTFAISTGALPAGLSLNTATGEITGTPTTVEAPAFTVDVYSNAQPTYIGYTNDNITIGAAPALTNYNCDCDDTYPTLTLADFRSYLMIRLGYAAMLAAPPPGMTELLNAFITEAQELLFRDYPVFRLERWFTWSMTAGGRFYDIAANVDACTKKLDPRMVTWVGISLGDNIWRPLHCGIDPARYSSRPQSIPDSYEIRQCIEVWPAPSDANWLLRVKGYFGLLPFAADTDVNTIDPQAIKLMALANAKAHYGQPDAGNYIALLKQLIGSYTAGSHDTRRYIPGRSGLLPAIPPVRSS
jgi:hypothetical protein